MPDGKSGSQLHLTEEAHQALTLTLMTEGVAPARARLSRLDAQGATVTLPGADCSPFQRDTAAVLRFDSARIGGQMDVTCTVADLRGSSSNRELVLVFDDEKFEGGAGIRRLMGLFNQRRAYRVTPPPGETFSLLVRGRGSKEWFEARLADISVLGVGLFVDSERLREVPPGAWVTLRLMMPGSVDPLRLRAAVKNVQPIPTRPQARLGLEFASEGLDPVARKLITRYVMERQLAERRGRLGE